MKSLTTLLLCLIVFLPLSLEPALAGGKDEITLSGTYVNPDAGATAWAFTGEYLIAAGPFVIGPSFSIFDGGEVDGNALGLAGELNLTGLSGLFVGGAAHRLGGDAGDVADYTYEARAGFKFGDGNGFCKVYVAKTWTDTGEGDLVAPDGVTGVLGVGLRF
jgi:hypothetical protein